MLDWATLVKRRNNPKEYDVFTTGIGPFYDPTPALFLSCSWPGWTCDEDIQKLQTGAGPGDRSQEAAGAVGAADQAVLREGPGDPVRRPLRPPRGPQDREGLQRADGAAALLQRVAGEITRRAGGLTRPHAFVSRPAPPRRHPGDGGGGDGRVPAHPPDPGRSGERDAGARRDPEPDRRDAQGDRARPAAARAARWASTPGCCAATSASPTSWTGR